MRTSPLSLLLLTFLACEVPSQTGPDESPAMTERQPAQLQLGTSEAVLAPGEGLQLTVGFSGGQGLTLSTLGYQSADPAIAKVSATGLIEALAVGSTVVKVTATFLPGGSTAQANLPVRVLAPQPTLQLTSTPMATTNETRASVGWTVNGAPESAVRCSRDGLSPTACTNPFVLGATTPLTPGAHRVDFWVDQGSGVDVAHPLASFQWTITSSAPPPSLQLSGLPMATTAATTASISHQVLDAVGGESVFCRLDAFAPIACPNPFVLGASTPLAAGSHTVDFFLVASGGTLDSSRPSASHQWTIRVAPPPPSLQLGGLPAVNTMTRTASITHQVLDGVGGETVHCRLDAYAPIACPNPFVLGATNPLAIGAHSVDYYLVASGAALDVAQPTVHVAWTIASSAGGGTAGGGSAGGSAGGGNAGTGGGAGATALPALPYSQAALAIDGNFSSYDGTTPLSWNGNVMLGPVVDPNGSGRTVNLHRIMQAAPYAWGTTHRAELLWMDDPNTSLPVGLDTWQAFAVMRKPGESQPASVSDDSLLVFQSHSPESGNTYPPYALVFARQTNDVRWEVSYNSRPVSQWASLGAVEGSSTIHREPLPPEGQWYRYILHYRAGYLASQNPLIEVWRAKPGGPFQLLVTHTGPNTYNGGAAYPRIGPYKWDGDWHGQSSLAFFETPLFYGRGANLFQEAAASLQGF